MYRALKFCKLCRDYETASKKETNTENRLGFLSLRDKATLQVMMALEEMSDEALLAKCSNCDYTKALVKDSIEKELK